VKEGVCAAAGIGCRRRIANVPTPYAAKDGVATERYVAGGALRVSAAVIDDGSSPAMPAPVALMGSMPRAWEFTSKVAPLAIVTPTFVLPNAVALPAANVPDVMMVVLHMCSLRSGLSHRPFLLHSPQSLMSWPEPKCLIG